MRPETWIARRRWKRRKPLLGPRNGCAPQAFLRDLPGPRSCGGCLPEIYRWLGQDYVSPLLFASRSGLRRVIAGSGRHSLPVFRLHSANDLRALRRSRAIGASFVSYCIGERRSMQVDEHRAAARRRLLKAGKISFGGGAIDCTVRNFSDSGAALDVISPSAYPKTSRS